MEAPVYVLENVSKTYELRGGLVEALRNICIRLNSGVYAVVGPNGSGKSTLLRVLAGVTVPEKGRIVYRGRVFWRDCGDSCIAALRRREIGYLPQSLLTPPFLKVADVAGMPLWLDGDPEWRSKTMPVLRELEIDNLAERRIKSLSMGLRQRVAIARALLAGRRVVLLDEPFSHLDDEGVERLLEALRRRAEHLLVVVATPSEAEAEMLEERLGARRLCIKAGRVFSCEQRGLKAETEQKRTG